MRTAEELALALRRTSRGVFLLTWREKSELAGTLLVLQAALDGTPVELVELKSLNLSPEATKTLAARQAAAVDDDPAPLLLVFLGETVGRTAGRTLNGWRRGLARERGSLLVVHASEATALLKDAPDLASFLTGQRALADGMLALWSSSTAQVLERWLGADSLPLPRALAALPGGDLDVGELRDWLRHHLAASRDE